MGDSSYYRNGVLQNAFNQIGRRPALPPQPFANYSGPTFQNQPFGGYSSVTPGFGNQGSSGTGYSLLPDFNQAIRNSDNAVIPFDPGNSDYQSLLDWRNAGGVYSNPAATQQPVAQQNRQIPSNNAGVQGGLLGLPVVGHGTGPVTGGQSYGSVSTNPLPGYGPIGSKSPTGATLIGYQRGPQTGAVYQLSPEEMAYQQQATDAYQARLQASQARYRR